MKLILNHIVSKLEKQRSFGDRRRKVNVTLASYFDEDHHEYRKSFESYEEPIVPTTGTHYEINKLKIQY